MKTKLFCIFALLSKTAFNQSTFNIEYYQGFTSIHELSSIQKIKQTGFKISDGGLKLSYSYNSSENFIFEPYIGSSILLDHSSVQQRDGRELQADVYYGNSSDLLNTYYKLDSKIWSMQQFIGFNLLFKASKYLSVGGGVNLNIVTTGGFDYLVSDVYNTNGSTSTLSNRAILTLPYSKTKPIPTLPIVVRGTVPLKGEKFHLRISLIGHLSWKSSLQATIGFGF